MWELEFSEQFTDAQHTYDNQLQKAIFIASLPRRNTRRSVAESVERACSQYDEFLEFLRRLKAFGVKHRDPQILPAALDDDGNAIPDFYCFEDDKWVTYLYRVATSGREQSRALLLFLKSDLPKNLKDVLDTAKALQGAA